MSRKRNCHHVVWSFRRPSIVLRMKLNTHRGWIDDDAKIAIVGGVVVFKRQGIVDHVGRPVGRAHRRKRRMSSASCYKKRNLHLVHGPRKALVIMCMSGEDRM